ncbi:hypothetical protein EDC96DRAFT_187803 [Choanephora cucurbitarum]|nr:hypothetical protein EDC96DRAFT_187803 [Choanephora cucurbitarum]
MSSEDQVQLNQTIKEKEMKKKEDPAACVFVASLSKDVPDEELQSDVFQHFLQWGTLSSVKVLKDWLKRPYAFVQFERVEDSKTAIKEAPGTILHGRSIRCEPARVNRSICLVSFSQPFHKKFIRSALSSFGEIEDITVLQPHGKFHSIVVKFRYREDAIKAYLTLRFSDFEQISRHQQRWFVEWASNMDTDNLYGICGNACRLDKSSVFVGNLPQDTQQEELYSLFGSYGKVLNVHLIQKPYNRCPEKKVFAFIKYQHPFEAAQAIDQENGNVFKDKTLRVSYRQQYQRNPCQMTNRIPPLSIAVPPPPPDYFQHKFIEEYGPPQYMPNDTSVKKKNEIMQTLNPC